MMRVIDSNEHFAGEIEELRRWLKPLDCTSDMIAAEDGFTGRQWLLGDVCETRSGGNADTNAEPTGEIERWRTDGTPRKVFWIAAEPGWGKSALSARLAHAGRARVMAVHFCKYDQPDRRDARRVVRSIAFQMAMQLGEYRSLLVEAARRDTTLDDKTAKEIFQSLLADPLGNVIEGGRGPHDRHLIVLDALDEAVDADGRSDLLTLVSSEFGKLPSWLGLLVTSRPEAPVMRQLGRFGVHALKADDPRNLLDVQTYAQAWLERLPLDQAQRATALRAVMQAGQGNFLYLRQLERAVLDGIVPSDQLTQAASLPKGLASLYERWFLHRFADPVAYQRVQRPLLELMLAAREPLPLDLAAHLLSWGAYGQDGAQQDDSLLPLGSLCVQTSTEDAEGTTITFFHKSLRDWVADAQATGRHWQASEAEGQRALAAGLWQAYRAWSEAGAGLEQDEGFEELGAAGQAYALRHLPAHLKTVRRTRDYEAVLTDFALAMRRCARGALEPMLEDYREEKSAPRSSAIQAWADCIGTNAHILRRGVPKWPAHKILLQVAAEHADDSAITVAAQQWLPRGQCDWVWMKRRDRPQVYAPNPCLMVLEGHTNGVDGAEVLRDGRILSWSSFDDTLRLWDGQSGAALAVLEGHTDGVEGAKVLPDGRILSWSLDNTLRLWDDQNAAALAVLEGHTKGLTDAEVLPNAIQPEGRFTKGVIGAEVLSDGRILSWSDDGTLRLWDGQSGGALAVLEGHTDRVNGADVLPDGRILSWSWDNTLRLWDGQSGGALAVLEGHTHGVEGTEVLPDGRILSWSLDKTLRLWDGRSAAALAVLEGHTKGGIGAEVLPDGRILSWSRDGTLRLWNGQSGAALAVLEGHTDRVNGADVLPDGRILSWSSDGALRLWDGQNGGALAVLEGHTSWVIGAEVLPDGRILSWSDDGTLRLWDGQSGAALAVLEGHTDGVEGVKVLPDGRILSWSLLDNTLRLWDARSGGALAVLEGQMALAESAKVLPDGRILSWSMSNTLRLWDGQSGAAPAVLEGHTKKVCDAKVLPDGRILSWSRDNTLRLWDGHSGAALAVLEGHTNLVNGADVLPDGRILSWSRDDTLRLWNGQSGRALAVLEGHKDWVEGAKVLPDGRILSWPLVENTLRLWHGQSGAALAVLEGHTDRVNGADVLPDGRVLSWSYDNTLRLWHVQSGAALAVLEGHTEQVNGATVLPDGRILSWSYDNTLRIWDGQSAAALAVLEGHTDRVTGAEVLSDGRILSWSSWDGSLRLWDGQSGACLEVMPADGVETRDFADQWRVHGQRAGLCHRGTWWAQAIGGRISIADTATGHKARWHATAASVLVQTAAGLLCGRVGDKLVFLETWRGAQPFPLDG